jgi:TAT (twin-arginine translocation) pathway signal sequence
MFKRYSSRIANIPRRKFLKYLAVGGAAVAVGGVAAYELLGKRSTSVDVNETDYEFFIKPWIPNILKLLNVAMETPDFSATPPVFGFNKQYMLPWGGETPEGNSGQDACVLIDNAIEMMRALDYWNGYVMQNNLQSHCPNSVPTTCETSTRAWLNSTFQENGTANTSTYNGQGRWETLFGNKISGIYGTQSQIWYAFENTPDEQPHLLGSEVPVVTALPYGPAVDPTAPSNMEEFGPKILLQYILGNAQTAAQMFSGVMSSVTSDGDVSGSYGGGVIRDIAYTLYCSRVVVDPTTGKAIWKSYPNQISSMLNLLWSHQQPNGGMPQEFANFHNTTTPEPIGQTLFVSDPNAPSYFANQ